MTCSPDTCTFVHVAVQAEDVYWYVLEGHEEIIVSSRQRERDNSIVSRDVNADNSLSVISEDWISLAAMN